MYRTDSEKKEHNARMRNPLAATVARDRYAFPGGYALFAMTDDGGALCSACCRSEYWRIADAFPGDGWSVIAIGCAAELDAAVYCDHCSQDIDA